MSVATNGNEAGPVDIVYTVTLSQANNTGAAITFDLADLGTGSATAGADYGVIPVGAQISVANGATTGTYTVSVTNDLLLETLETVNAQISNSSHPAVAIGTAAATAGIADDDDVQIIIAATTNAAEPATNGRFTVALNPSAIDTTASYTVAGTATPGAGGDYATLSGSVTILADTDETPVEQPSAGVVARVPAGVVPQEKLLIADGQLPAVRAEAAEILETKSLHSEIRVEPMRVEMEVLPIGAEERLDVLDEERQRIVLNSGRISRIGLSAGAL